MNEQKVGDKTFVYSLYPLTATAIPDGDDWLILFSGTTQIGDIDPATRDVLARDAIARAKAEQILPFYGFTDAQLTQIRQIVREELKGREHDDHS